MRHRVLLGKAPMSRLAGFTAATRERPVEDWLKRKPLCRPGIFL
jgi:hypothetical protein